MNLRVHRLSLTIQGTPRFDPRRFAEQLASDLSTSAAARTPVSVPVSSPARGPATATAEHVRAPHAIGRLRVDVSQTPATSNTGLSRQIADRVLRAVARRV